MGFRFRKSFKVAPGVRLNVSKRGAGVSGGVKGARVSVGPGGTRGTVGIPGSGLSYEHRFGGKSRLRRGGACCLPVVAVPVLTAGAVLLAALAR